MNLAVLGLGTFGRNLTISLYEAGHQVSVLDNDAKAVAGVQDQCELALVADCTDRTALAQMHLDAVTCAVVALGQNLGASVLCTLMLKEMGVPRVISKAMTAEHKTILKRVGADQVVFPEQEAAARLAMALTYPNLLEYLPISDEYSIMELAPPKAMVGKTLKDLDLRRKYGIKRGGGARGGARAAAAGGGAGVRYQGFRRAGGAGQPGEPGTPAPAQVSRRGRCKRPGREARPVGIITRRGIRPNVSKAPGTWSWSLPGHCRSLWALPGGCRCRPGCAPGRRIRTHRPRDPEYDRCCPLSRPGSCMPYRISRIPRGFEALITFLS